MPPKARSTQFVRLSAEFTSTEYNGREILKNLSDSATLCIWVYSTRYHLNRLTTFTDVSQCMLHIVMKAHYVTSTGQERGSSESW